MWWFMKVLWNLFFFIKINILLNKIRETCNVVDFLLPKNPLFPNIEENDFQVIYDLLFFLLTSCILSNILNKRIRYL